MLNEFIEWIKAVVKEAKSTIWKVQENMTRRSLTPVFYPGDQVFLDVSNIKTTCPSLKLFHCHLRPFVVEHQVEPLVYYFKLLHTIKKLHLVFNIVKLSTTPDNLIPE